MSELNPSASTNTNIDGTYTDYQVPSYSLDHQQQNENIVYFKDATKHMGYYFNIPQVKALVDALGKWVVGKGWSVKTNKEKVILENITGWGEDTIDNIFWNMIVVKKICGDAFAEIIRNKSGTLINLKPISPERVRLILNGKGRIKRYEVNDGKDWVRKERQNMLHLCNDRFADQEHGTSMLTACEWVIKSLQEALATNKIVDRLRRALGVVEYEVDKAGKISHLNSVIENGIKNGEMIGYPKGSMEIKDFARQSTGDAMQWISYLENMLYQILGIPKIILGGSEQVSEGSSKMTTFTYEQIYISEQRQLEQDIWNQLAIKITFNKPASIADNVQENEAKNTSQTTMQPKDTAITGGRE